MTFPDARFCLVRLWVSVGRRGAGGGMGVGEGVGDRGVRVVEEGGEVVDR